MKAEDLAESKEVSHAFSHDDKDAPDCGSPPGTRFVSTAAEAARSRPLEDLACRDLEAGRADAGIRDPARERYCS